MPFSFYNRLESAPTNFCPISEFSKVILRSLTITKTPFTKITKTHNIDSSSSKGKEKVEAVKVSIAVKKVTFFDQGMGEYTFENALCIGKPPLSPQSFGKPF